MLTKDDPRYPTQLSQHACTHITHMSHITYHISLFAYHISHIAAVTYHSAMILQWHDFAHITDHIVYHRSKVTQHTHITKCISQNTGHRVD